jgi:NADP-dependent 3-hydroxy acid dehydrogenase YdfG
MARALDGAGLRVCVTGRRQERVDQIVEGLSSDAMGLVLDVTDEDSVKSAFARVKERWGGLDVLVNNAGLGYQETLLGGSTERWREMLEVNVLGLLLCTREGVAVMRGRNEGHVFFLGSLSGHRIPAGSNLYGATKYAVRSLTESLRQEMHAERLPIRVSAVSPGFVQTEFHRRYFDSEEKSRELYERYRVLDPEDIAQAMLYALGSPPHVAVHDVLIRSAHQPT